MRAIATPSITGDFIRKCQKWKKQAPLLYWPAAPFLAVFVLSAWGICWVLWRAAWQGFALCAWLGIDLEAE